MVFRAERAISAATDQPAWVVIDEDYVLQPEANSYLAALRARDRSVNTERVYAGRIALYLSYCRRAGLDWRAPSPEALAGFLKYLVAEPIPPRGRNTVSARYRSKPTANAVMTVVCELLRFGSSQGWVSPSVVNGLSKPKFLVHAPPGFNAGEEGQFRQISAKTIKFAVPHGGFQWLSDDQLAQLTSAEMRPRDRFLIALMAVTGMRIGEVLGLRREDMHLLARAQDLGCQVRGSHVHVRRRVNTNAALAKSRYPRTIPVTDEVVGLYADYQYERYQTRTEDSDMVFVNQFRPPVGRPMTYSNAKDLFDRLSKRLGFQVRPHMLRHTAANSWRRQGVPRDVLQELLGHVSSSSMEPYFHPTDGEKRRAVERVAALRDGSR